MKKLLMICMGTLLLWVMACKEEPPYINYEPEYVTYETTYVDVNVPVPQPREVLIEDISGVQCVNCPKAAKIVKDLKEQYPGRVNSITIYPKGINDLLTAPVNKPDEGIVSKYDLRTAAGAQIVTTLDIPNTLPSGYVDRKEYSGKQYRYIDYLEWGSKVEEEKDSVTPVNISLTPSYEGENKVNVDVKLTFTSNLTGDYYVSVALIQDSIIDVQEAPDPNVGAVYLTDYAHMHVLRKMFTANMGDKINTATTTLVSGRVVIKRYSIALENEVNSPPFPPYNKKHLAVIAFVHRASDGVIVQSKEMEIHE